MTQDKRKKIEKLPLYTTSLLFPCFCVHEWSTLGNKHKLKGSCSRTPPNCREVKTPPSLEAAYCGTSPESARKKDAAVINNERIRMMRERSVPTSEKCLWACFFFCYWKVGNLQLPRTSKNVCRMVGTLFLRTWTIDSVLLPDFLSGFFSLLFCIITAVAVPSGSYVLALP